MPIYTTYLAKKPISKARELGSCFVYFVMRNRGNNEVAPDEWMLTVFKRYGDIWEEYKRDYLKRLSYPKAQNWMEKRAYEAKIGNILLVCYEKYSQHCHRAATCRGNSQTLRCRI